MGKASVVYTKNGTLFSLKREIVTQATTRTDREDMMPSELSQLEKDTLYNSTYMKYSEEPKFQRQESTVVVARGSN